MKHTLVKNLLLIAAVALLFATYFFLNHRDATQQAHRDNAARLLHWKPADITQLAFMGEDGNENRLMREGAKAGASWAVTVPGPLPVNESAVNNFLQGLIDLHLPSPLPLVDAKDDEFGLKEVSEWIRISDVNGKEITIKLGSINPLSRKRYLKIQGKPDIYVAGTEPFAALQSGLDSFLDHTLMSLESASISEITFSDMVQQDRWSVHKQNGNWMLMGESSDPLQQRAEGVKIEEILSILTTLEWKNNRPVPIQDGSIDEPDSKSFHLTARAPGEKEAKSYTISFISSATPLKDLYSSFTVRMSHRPFLYSVTLDARTRQTLFASSTDIRSKQAFEMFPWQITSIEWKRGEDSHQWRKEGEAWRESNKGASSKELDAQAMGALLEKLTHIKILEFIPLSQDDWRKKRASYGLDQPLLTGGIEWQETDNKEGNVPPHRRRFYMGKAANQPYLAVMEGNADLSDHPPEMLEVWKIDEDLAALFRSILTPIH